jgi:hypothetical protein
MKKIFILFFICCNFSITLFSQNVAINGTGAAPRNCAMLDILSSNTGLLIPTVALTNVTAYLPLTGTAVDGLLVYSSAAPTGGNGTGYYYWSTSASRWVSLVDNLTPGNPWYVGGNLGTTASTSAYGVAANNSYIGTNDNQALVFVSNTFERMRIRTDGEVIVGAQTTVIADDLFSGVGNTTLDWAVNGYSGFDGSGVYGQITGGATLYAGVQGEYNGTNVRGAGVRGLILNATAGTSFNNLVAGVSGTGGTTLLTAGTYKFGVYGNGGATTRSGGVLGNCFGNRGALGYFDAASTNYCVYGFGTAYQIGLATGRFSSNSSNITNKFNQPNATVGIGIYGGVMGGWIKGLVYGTNFSGQKYGVYVHGNTITNDKYVQLNNSSTSDVRIASYATTALTNELTSKGKVILANGQASIAFDSKLMELCDLNSLVITATPMGNCNGIYIDDISENGFSIKEINNGSHNVSVSFIISGTLKQATEFTETDILNKQYETNLNGVMHNDYDSETDGTPIWYDGQNVRHDAVDEELTGRKRLMEIESIESEKYRKPMKKITQENK